MKNNNNTIIKNGITYVVVGGILVPLTFLTGCVSDGTKQVGMEGLNPSLKAPVSAPLKPYQNAGLEKRVEHPTRTSINKKEKKNAYKWGMYNGTLPGKEMNFNVLYSNGASGSFDIPNSPSVVARYDGVKNLKEILEGKPNGSAIISPTELLDGGIPYAINFTNDPDLKIGMDIIKTNFLSKDVTEVIYKLGVSPDEAALSVTSKDRRSLGEGLKNVAVSATAASIFAGTPGAIAAGTYSGIFWTVDGVFNLLTGENRLDKMLGGGEYFVVDGHCLDNVQDGCEYRTQAAGIEITDRKASDKGSANGLESNYIVLPYSGDNGQKGVVLVNVAPGLAMYKRDGNEFHAVITREHDKSFVRRGLESFGKAAIGAAGTKYIMSDYSYDKKDSGDSRRKCPECPEPNPNPNPNPDPIGGAYGGEVGGGDIWTPYNGGF